MKRFFKVGFAAIEGAQRPKCQRLKPDKFFGPEHAFLDPTLELGILDRLRNADRREVAQAQPIARQIIVLLGVLERPDQWRSRVEAGNVVAVEAVDIVGLGEALEYAAASMPAPRRGWPEGTNLISGDFRGNHAAKREIVIAHRYQPARGFCHAAW